MLKLPSNKNAYRILYKLLGDVLFLLSFFFALTLIVEGLIPGLVSDHISFFRLIIILALTMVGLLFAGRLGEISTSTSSKNKKTSLVLGFLSAILIFNGLLKIHLYLSLIILILCLTALHFIHKNLFEQNP